MAMQMRVSVWGDMLPLPGGSQSKEWIPPGGESVPELLTQAPSWQGLTQRDGEMAFTGLHAD